VKEIKKNVKIVDVFKNIKKYINIFTKEKYARRWHEAEWLHKHKSSLNITY